MNKWVFDLKEETRPIHRLGIIGLERLLRYGEGSDRYPTVQQTDTLKWELTDTTVTLHFAGVDDLNRLMACQLGDFRDGLAVPPGFEGDLSQPGAYLTVRQHQGIVSGKQGEAPYGAYFFAKKGGRRSASLGATERTDLQILEISEGKPLTVSYTRHMLCAEPPALKDLKPRDLGNVFHPAMAKWNNIAVRSPAQDAFVLSFSCLAYVFTYAGAGFTGIGVDLPSFMAVDDAIYRWARPRSSAEENRNLLWTDGASTTAAWFLAAALRLPPNTYSLIAPEGHRLIHIDAELAGPLYGALAEAIHPATANGMIRRTWSIPVRKVDDKTFVSALDCIIRNLTDHHALYRDLGGVATVKRNNITGLYAGERQALLNIVTHLENSLNLEETKSIRIRMSQIYQGLVSFYVKERGISWNDARSRARDHFINARLNRSFNAKDLLASLSWIRKEAPSVWWFTPEEADTLQRLALTEPGTLRALLLFACEVQPVRKAKPEGTNAEADVAETPELAPDGLSDEVISIPDDLTV